MVFNSKIIATEDLKKNKTYNNSKEMQFWSNSELPVNTSYSDLQGTKQKNWVWVFLQVDGVREGKGFFEYKINTF